MADDLDDLQRLAPAVDSERARVSFRRRRRRSRSTRRGGMALAAVTVLVAGTVGVVANLDDGAPVVAGPGEGVPAGPVTFEVLHVGEAKDEMGTLRSAVDESEYEELWLANESDAKPTINFAEQVVVSLAIPDDACPPELTAFDRDGEVLTPVFVETTEGCVQPLIPKTFVVAIDRTTVGSSFTLRLPADTTFGFDEQRLRVDLTDGAGSAPEGPRVWLVPPSWNHIEQAGLGGILDYDADLDCFFLTGLIPGYSAAVVWPKGTVGVADGPGVRLPDGEVIRVGDGFTGGGGGHDRSQADLFGVAPECVTDDIHVFQSDVEVHPSVTSAAPDPTCAEISAFAESVPDLRSNADLDYASAESPEALLDQATIVFSGELTGVVGIDDAGARPAVTYEVELGSLFKGSEESIADWHFTFSTPSPVPVDTERLRLLQDAAVIGIPVVGFAYALDSVPGYSIGVEGLVTACPGEGLIGLVSPRWTDVGSLDDLTRRLEQAAR